RWKARRRNAIPQSATGADPGKLIASERHPEREDRGWFVLRPQMLRLPLELQPCRHAWRLSAYARDRPKFAASFVPPEQRNERDHANRCRHTELNAGRLREPVLLVAGYGRYAVRRDNGGQFFAVRYKPTEPKRRERRHPHCSTALATQ